ncbi:hypothetical protein SEVIR_3G370100v4 [Setaria viridis]
MSATLMILKKLVNNLFPFQNISPVRCVGFFDKCFISFNFLYLL